MRDRDDFAPVEADARPPREEYVLTQAGRGFLPVLQALGDWGRRYNGEGRVSHIVDAETGARIEPIVVDRATGLPVGSRPTRLVISD